MYKLAEFRKKLEKSSGSVTIQMPLYDYRGMFSGYEYKGYKYSEDKNRLLNGVASLVVANGVIHEYESIKKVCKCEVDAIWLKKKIESTRYNIDSIAPIRDIMKRVNEIHSQPR